MTKETHQWARYMNKTMPYIDTPSYDIWLRECERFAAICLGYNPKFDVSRFLETCKGK